MLVKFTTGASNNWGRFSRPVTDALYRQQAQKMDEQERLQLVKEMQKRILERTWRIQGLWANRLEIRLAHIRNYEPPPGHWTNRHFEDVWLAPK